MEYWVVPSASGGDGSLGNPWGYKEDSATLWATVGAGDSVFFVGTFPYPINVGAQGALGSRLLLRGDYASGRAKVEVAQPATWTGPDGNGEYYITNPSGVAQFIVLEDGKRIKGPSFSSMQRPEVTAIDTTANTLTFGNLDTARAFQAGDTCVFGGGGTAPTGLSKNALYYIKPTGTFNVCQVCTDAALNNVVDIEGSFTSTLWAHLVQASMGDTVAGALAAGTYALDLPAGRLYYKPTSGAPGDHDVRVAPVDYSNPAGIYINDKDYVTVRGFEVSGVSGSGMLAAGGSVNPVFVDNRVWGCVNGIIGDNAGALVARSNYVFDIGWHGIGSVGVSTAEPDMLAEFNRIFDVGRLNDFGDLQGLVTNPLCHNTIFRFNWLERIGRNDGRANTGAMVVDSSHHCHYYGNTLVECHGDIVEIGSGSDGSVDDARIFGNLCIRPGHGYSTSETGYAMTNFVRVSVAGGSTDDVTNTYIYNNDIMDGEFYDANQSIDGGAFCLRCASTTYGGIIDGVHIFNNIVANCNQNYILVLRAQNSPSPLPSNVTFNNNVIFGGTHDGIAEIVSYDGAQSKYWDQAHMVGDASGYYTYDRSQTGNLAVDPNLSPEYLPNAGSPCIGAGIMPLAGSVDRVGAPFGVPPVIGAYEVKQEMLLCRCGG